MIRTILLCIAAFMSILGFIRVLCNPEKAQRSFMRLTPTQFYYIQVFVTIIELAVIGAALGWW